MGVTHFLCNYVTNTGQRWLYLGSLCSRQAIQNVDRIPTVQVLLETYIMAKLKMSHSRYRISQTC